MAVREIFYKDISYEISYDIINQDAKEYMIFLHGWGSNKEIMKASFRNLFKGYKHLYIDLPGFGNSSITAAIDTQDYANIIELFLQSLHVKKDYIFGHSYGGKVATLLNPDVLILLSSAGILVQKDLSTRLKIRFFKLFKNFLPKSMFRFFASKDVAGMSQTMYEILKKVVNEDFSDIFLQRKKRTFLFWGEKDSATPLLCGKKIHSLIQDSSLKVFDGDHFFFTKYASEIEKDMKLRL
jgi:pimeloyl-ACP methyl ester carboxylesterase